jgi:hypothetical protein
MHDLSRLRLDHPFWRYDAKIVETGSGPGSTVYSAYRNGVLLTERSVGALRRSIEYAERSNGWSRH